MSAAVSLTNNNLKYKTVQEYETLYKVPTLWYEICEDILCVSTIILQKGIANVQLRRRIQTKANKMQCPCYTKCKDCAPGFQKIINLENAGLVIYRHTTHTEDVDTKTGNVEHAVDTSEDVYILHNTTDKDITSADYWPEMEQNTIKCPRCIKIKENARKLLKIGPTISGNDVKGICDHCKMKDESCYKCQKIVKSFIPSKPERTDVGKERVKHWLGKIKLLLDDTSRDKKLPHFDVHTNQPYRNLKSPVSELDVEQLFGPHKLDSASSIRSSKDKKKVTNFPQLEKLEHPILFKDPLKRGMSSYANEDLDFFTDTVSVPYLNQKANLYTKEKDSQNHLHRQYNSTETLLTKVKDIRIGNLQANEIIFPKRLHKSAEEDAQQNKKNALQIKEDAQLNKKDAQLNKKDAQQIKEDAQLKKKDAQLKKKDAQLNKKDAQQIKEDAQLNKKDAQLNKKDAQLNKKDAQQIKEDAQLNKKDAQLNKKDAQLNKKDTRQTGNAAQKDTSKAELDAQKGALSAEKNFKIAEKNARKAALIAQKNSKTAEENARKAALIDQKNSKTAEENARKAALIVQKNSKTAEEDAQKNKKDAQQNKKDAQQLKKDAQQAVNAAQKDTSKAETDAKKASLKRAEDNLNKTGKDARQAKIVDESSVEAMIRIQKAHTRTDKDLKNIKHKKDDDDMMKNVKQFTTNKEKPEKRIRTAGKTLEPQAKTLERQAKKGIARGLDDLISKLNKLKQLAHEGIHHTSSDLRVAQNYIEIHCEQHTHHKNEHCLLCANSDIALEFASLCPDNEIKEELSDIIVGQQILKFRPPRAQIADVSEEKDIGKHKDIPPEHTATISHIGTDIGFLRYSLSDRKFIDNGWTQLPTEKVVRKMNVYRMHPSRPEFDWFEHNRDKRLMQYDTGEKLAEFDENGRGRWFYRNGRIALVYYDAEEQNAGQRFVVYSTGEPDERGRSRRYTLLATFDYMGNGIVFDHNGKIRLKYNQTEGVLLDRSIGPVSHWKWHTLNDPPVLQQVMLDTEIPHKDPDIMKMGKPGEDKPKKKDDEDMLAIEFDNIVKEKSKKLSQTFRPFQIRMKALKINEHFSLRVLDQATVYLLYRDGTTNLKLNIGMVLDNREIVDTVTADVGNVSNNLEKLPARTESLAGLQKSIAKAQQYDRMRTERERKLYTGQVNASVDQLVAGVSRPIPRQFSTTEPSGSPVISAAENCKCNRKPTATNVYYDTRFY